MPLHRIVTTLVLALSISALLSQASNEQCTSAEPLSCMDTIRIESESLTTSSFSGCVNTETTGYWYEISGDGSIVKFDYLSGDSDFLYLQAMSGVCDSLVCIRHLYIRKDQPAAFLLPQGEQAFIFIDGQAVIGETTVAISCLETHDNIDCARAISMTCDEVLGIHFSSLDIQSDRRERWYEIEGQNEVISISFDYSEYSESLIEVYEDSCSSSVPIHRSRLTHYHHEFFNFYGTLGRPYFIRVTQTFNSAGIANMEIACGQQPAEDNCNDAIDITNTPLVTGNDHFSLEYDDNSFTCSSGPSSSLWYKIIGADSLIEVEFLPELGVGYGVRGDSCSGERICLVDLGPRSRFYGASEREYFLQVGSYNRSLTHDISFVHDNITSAAHVVCDRAADLVCGSIDTLDFASSLGEFYYNVIGDNTIKEVTLDRRWASESYRVRLRSGNCENSQFIASYYLQRPGDSFRFLAEVGKTYILKIDGGIYINGSSEWSFLCHERLPNDLCDGSLTINHEDTISGSFIAASLESTSYLCSYRSTEDIWYKIVGDGRINRIDLLASDAFPIIADVYEGNCSQLSCLAERTFYHESSSDLIFYTEEGQDYYVSFRPYNELAIDSFLFRLYSVEPAPNDDCTGAYDINCGGSYSDDTYSASPEAISYGCYNRSGGVWYSVEGNGKIIQLKFTRSTTNRVSVSVFDENCLDNECVIRDRELDLYEQESSVYFEALNGVQYNILISEGYGNTSFDFELSCHDIISNDQCSNAISIMCQDTVIGDNRYATLDTNEIQSYYPQSPGIWYSFDGDGQIYRVDVFFNLLRDLDFRIFEYTHCNDLKQVVNSERQRSNKFLSVAGQKYYILFYGDDYFDRGVFKFTLTCSEPLSNNNCSTPLNIDCGQSEDIDFASITVDNNYCNYGTAGAWYKIIGDDMIHHIKIDSSTRYNIELTLYESTDCDSLVCIEDNNDGLLSFRASEGQEYLFAVSIGERYDEGFVRLSIDCYEPASNDFITNAAVMQCDDIVNVNTYRASGDEDPFCNDYNFKGLYYAFEGNGEILTLTAQSFDRHTITFHIYIDDGSGPLCVRSTELSHHNNSLDMITYAGLTYIIGIGGGRDGNLPTDFDLEVTCSTPEGNDSCSDAILLSCGSTIEGSTAGMHGELQYSCGYGRYTHSPVVWYKIIGDGTYYNVRRSNATYGNLEIELYIGSCTDLICIEQSPSFDFYAKVGEEYFIAVYNGLFSITTTCYDDPVSPNDLCESASLITCGETVNASFDNAALDIETALCDAPNAYDGIWYVIEGTGDLMEFVKEGYADIGIMVFTGTCDDLMCIGQQEPVDQYRTFKFRSEVNKTYYVLLYDYRDIEDFTFSLMCRPPLNNDVCEEALILECGQNYDIPLGDILANDHINDCTADLDDYAIWFKIEGDGQRYILENVDNHGSSENLLVFSGSCEDCNGLVDFDQTGYYSRDHKIIIDTHQDSTYFIPISYRGFGSQQRLTFDVRCVTVSDHGDMAFAQPLKCNDTLTIDLSTGIYAPDDVHCDYAGYALWYKIEGDGLVHQIEKLENGLYTETEVSVLADSSGHTYCIMHEVVSRTNGYLKFFTQDSKTYFIRFADRRLKNKGLSEWTHRCIVQEPNDFCQEALSLECGEALTVSTMGATLDVLNIYGCRAHDSESVWYRVKGGDYFLSLTPQMVSNESLEFSLMEGGCEDLICLDHVNFNRDQKNVSFYLAEGSTYVIQVSGGRLYEELDIELSAECVQPAQNDMCINATKLACGDSIRDSLDFALDNEDYLICGIPLYKGIWYSIKGTGGIVQLKFQNPSYGLRRGFFKGECNSLTCVPDSDIFYNSDGSTRITTLENATYYLYVSENFNWHKDFSFEVNCYEGPCVPSNGTRIVGPEWICSDLSAVTYFVNEVEGFTYTWSITGSAASIVNRYSSMIQVDFSNDFQQEILTVHAINNCGDDVTRSMTLRASSSQYCEMMRCVNDHIFVDDDMLSEFNFLDYYRAIETIGSDALIGRYDDLIFEAGREVDFYPGFEVEQGASFMALIKSCMNSN